MTPLYRCAATDRNKTPIAKQLKRWISGHEHVLEIGARTLQHAEHLVTLLPNLRWLASDIAANMNELHRWHTNLSITSISEPVELEVSPSTSIPPSWLSRFEGVFTANTLHIMQPQDAREVFRLAREALNPKGWLIIYGPFSENGQHNSPGNERFDHDLKAQGYGGIRDLTELADWGNTHYLTLAEWAPMPANNRLLKFIKHKRPD